MRAYGVVEKGSGLAKVGLVNVGSLTVVREVVTLTVVRNMSLTVVRA